MVSILVWRRTQKLRKQIMPNIISGRCYKGREEGDVTENDGCRLGHLKMEEEGGEGKAPL